MGGFLMALPEGEAPATPAEADYYLVLTAHFERGDYYKGATGKDTGTQQVNSLTSVDLYDAATGAFLRHLGNLRESAPDTVYASYGDTSLQYPVPTKSDVLLYLYHNVNDPDAYFSLLDNTPVNGSMVAQASRCCSAAGRSPITPPGSFPSSRTACTSIPPTREISVSSPT